MDQQIKNVPEVFDSADLVARCLGNIAFAERVLAKFNSRFELDLAELEQAIQTQDGEGIARVAHRLKGAAANVAAGSLRAHAAGIEKAARAGDLPPISAQVDELRSQWRVFASCAAALGTT